MGESFPFPVMALSASVNITFFYHSFRPLLLLDFLQYGQSPFCRRSRPFVQGAATLLWKTTFSITLFAATGFPEQWTLHLLFCRLGVFGYPLDTATDLEPGYADGSVFLFAVSPYSTFFKVPLISFYRSQKFLERRTFLSLFLAAMRSWHPLFLHAPTFQAKAGGQPPLQNTISPLFFSSWIQSASIFFSTQPDWKKNAEPRLGRG